MADLEKLVSALKEKSEKRTCVVSAPPPSKRQPSASPFAHTASILAIIGALSGATVAIIRELKTPTGAEEIARLAAEQRDLAAAVEQIRRRDQATRDYLAKLRWYQTRRDNWLAPQFRIWGSQVWRPAGQPEIEPVELGPPPLKPTPGEPYIFPPPLPVPPTPPE